MFEYGTEGDDLFVGGEEIDRYDALGGKDTVRGNGGDDELNGGLGHDLMFGGDGYDRLFGDPGEDELHGDEGDDRLNGGASDDRLFGGAGNDNMDGADGADRLWGGDGDDDLSGGVYPMDAAPDELHGGAGNDTLDGWDGDDALYGDGGADLLSGYTGDDRMVGGAGNDYLFGREGVDSYDGGGDDGLDWEGYTSFIGDRAQISTRAATEAVSVDLRTGIVANDGFGNRETLTGIESVGGGTLFADTFYGDDRANHIAVSDGDIVMGFGGADLFSYNGAAGSLDGGAGVDTLLYIYGFKPNADAQPGDPNHTVYTDDGIVIDLLSGIVRDGFGTIGSIANVENIGGSHGVADDILRGDNKDNIIRGRGGVDVIDGRGGRDTVSYWQPEHSHYAYRDRSYGAVVVDLAAGYAAETAVKSGTVAANTATFGRDTLTGIENIIGTTLGDRLLGDSGRNVIAPDAGNDFVDGRGGIDTVDYGVVRGAVDVDLAAGVARQQGSGAPVLVEWREDDQGQRYTVETPADDGVASRDRLLNIENAIGSAYADRLAGNAGANRLDGGLGDDILVRSGGGDILIGGLGSDTADYAAAGAAVTIDLAAGSGSVRGVAGADRLLGVENAIGTAFADTLTGSRAANRLDGGAGIDRLDGGAGNDVYKVDDLRDEIADSAGLDRVEASVSLTLAAGLEQLVLTGAADLAGTGNDAANALTGNGGGNVLAGRGASDRLEGGAGRDAFLFDSALAGAGVDTILDFAAADDSIRLDRSFFGRFGETGTLRLAAFREGARAMDDSDRILYDQASGRIFYDADGNGAGAAILFARVDAGTALTAADFVIVA
jgi:serralysin